MEFFTLHQNQLPTKVSEALKSHTLSGFSSGNNITTEEQALRNKNHHYYSCLPLRKWSIILHSSYFSLCQSHSVHSALCSRELLIDTSQQWTVILWNHKLSRDIWGWEIYYAAINRRVRDECPPISKYTKMKGNVKRDILMDFTASAAWPDSTSIQINFPCAF